MIAAFIIIVIIVTLLLLIVGVGVQYDGGTIALWLKIGPITLKLLPRREAPGRPKKEKPKREKPKKEKPKKEKPKKEPGELIALAKDLAPVGFRTLSRFRRMLAVDELVLLYTAAASDACSAAMQYGYVSAGVNTVLGFLYSYVKFRELDVDIAVDFDRDSPVIFARLQVSIAIWEVLYIGLALGVELFKIYLKNRRQKGR